MKFSEYLELHFQLFRVLVLQIGLKCPLRCKHCSVYAGPSRRETLSPEAVAATVVDFSGLPSAQVVVVTGGEPFQDVAQLRTVLLHIAKFPQLHAYVITSAHWAPSLAAARKTLASLPPISLLMVSADEYHEEFVPRSYLRHAIVAAREAAADVVLSIAHHGEGDGYVAGLRGYLGEALWGDIEVDVVRVMPTGRAKNYGIGGFNTTPSALPEGACDLVGTPVVVANGNIIACCQIDAANEALRRADTPYFLGRAGVDSLADIERRFEDDLLMQALRVLGPAELVDILRSHGLEPQLEPLYDGICFLCRDLLKDPGIVAALRGLLADGAMRRRLWLGRIAQYGELRPCPEEAIA